MSDRDLTALDEPALESALHDAARRKDAARADAQAITAELDARRTRSRLLEKLGNLSAAEADLVRHGLALPAPVAAAARPNP